MIIKTMVNRANLVKLITYSIITGSIFIIFGVVPRYNQPVAPVVYAACRDTLTDCSCLGGNLVCSHQQQDCSVTNEIHNEMPGAPVCQSEPDASATPVPTISPYVSPVSTPIPSSDTSAQIGVGGGPEASPSPSSTPVAISSQTDSSGELPRTGPFDTLVLFIVIVVGTKLVAFKSKFVDTNPHLIWIGRQLKKK